MREKKILVVDDELFVRELIKIKLKLYGLEIIEGSNGFEAVDLALKEKPDLILLDLMMPKMDGFEACERLKADPKTAQIPIVILTARGEQVFRERGEAAGAVGIVTKPFSPQKLAEMVMEILNTGQVGKG